MAKNALRAALLFLLLGLVGCDHATKVAAKVALEGTRPLALIPGVLELAYTENRDTAFSLTRGLAWHGKEALLVALGSLALGLVLSAWWRRRHAASRVEHAAFVLVVGGAIGNVLDRLGRGYVIDFIHVQWWPVFNVADIAVSVGLGLFALVALFTRASGAQGREGTAKSG